MTGRIYIKSERRKQLDAEGYLRVLRAFAREIDEQAQEQRAKPKARRRKREAPDG